MKLEGQYVKNIEATAEEIAATFTEWDRRFREDPERFMNEAVRLLKQTPADYGEACAPCFCKILAELRRAKRFREHRLRGYGDG
ncbi:MAG: hypothetical protein QOI07_934 [Verrucomicrobiota bacterium]|jgi:hypothetical protein